MLPQTLEFIVKSSSSSDTYNVLLRCTADSIITMTCTCDAGVRQMLCKHRVALLNGDISALSSGYDQLQHLKPIIAGSEVEKLLSEIAGLEQAAAKIAAQTRGLKRSLGRLLG